MTEKADIVADLAARHAAAWSAHDAEASALLFSEDGSITVNSTTTHRGHAEIVESAKALMATFPDLKVICNTTRHAGDRAVFLWTLEGHHADTGHFVSLPGWHEWKLDSDMKVHICRGFYDAEVLARQIAGA
ncbi:SnoaL-like domain protein [Roseovarius litorisediminis]|uniref:SnoaL-like domain protein n=1 Tax=Roseovarius litorisediminis TaxID=1312363 RepID=A0A1Y5RST4_9RHOB|nr:nuclear transport factor 2 family protein [Roseovarius litorisediminis]SLN24651.1 SnoaL-like domain protein [Roseovarius litorisediminis]